MKKERSSRFASTAKPVSTERKLSCVARFDDAKMGVFKFGGVSVKRAQIPGWKMDSVFQTLKTRGYDVLNYMQTDDSFTVFVGHRKEERNDDGNFSYDSRNPNRDYFKFQFGEKDGAACVTVSHSFGSMHDIPLAEMKAAYEETSDDKVKELSSEERQKEWQRVQDFRNLHTIPSFTYGMKDEDIAKVVNSVQTEIDYIEDEWF